MTSISTLYGLLSCIILFICSCVHFKRIKALKYFIEVSKEHGPFSIFQKAAIVGIRLQYQIGIISIILAILILTK